MPYVFVIVSTAPDYFESGAVLFDPFFLIATGLAAIWSKPKDFQIQKTGNHVSVNPYFVLLHQLPIPKEVLIKNRFAIYYIYSVPSNMLFLTLIYVFSGTIQSMMTLPQYAAFSIIWISFGIYWGSIYAVSDIGEATRTSKVKSYVYLIIILALIVIGMILLHTYTGHGIVYWSMIIAKKWPLLSSVLSVTTAFISTIFWLRHANKTIEKVDYSI